MLTLKSTELIITLLTFFIAYMASVTVAGAFRAWVASKMGDDTADMLGLATLNPLAHVDLMGLFFLLIFYFGWGKYVPINPLNIHEPWRRIKIIIAYFSDTFSYLVSSIVGIIFLIMVGGPRVLMIGQQMLISIQNMSHLYLVTSSPMLSSLAITLSFIAIAFVYLNVVLGVLTFILNGVSLAMMFIMERSHRFESYNHYLIILVPIILIILFSDPLRILAIRLTSWIGLAISHALGMV
jgi:hypothetical protein